MLLLHLSDLHFGAHSRFKGEDLTRLGKAFFKDLEAKRGGFAKGSRIDLVAVTGDIAESGKPTEFKEGELSLAASPRDTYSLSRVDHRLRLPLPHDPG